MDWGAGGSVRVDRLSLSASVLWTELFVSTFGDLMLRIWMTTLLLVLRKAFEGHWLRFFRLLRLTKVVVVAMEGHW